MKKSLIFISLFLSLNALSQTSESIEYPKNMTVEQFKTRTAAKDKLIFVNFAADWCMMCKKQKPILDEIKSEKKEILDLIIIDMEENPLIAEYFNVDGLPINLLYKNGLLVWDRAGLKTKKELITQIGYFE